MSETHHPKLRSVQELDQSTVRVLYRDESSVHDVLVRFDGNGTPTFTPSVRNPSALLYLMKHPRATNAVARVYPGSEPTHGMECLECLAQARVPKALG
jgi:hypothetical protein